MTVCDTGPGPAYELMSGRCRLPRVGPAFGTKFLHFCDPGRHRLQGLILDRFIAGWLKTNGLLTVRPTAWSRRQYQTYLELMHRWADEARVPAEDIELAIFTDQATRVRSQWGSRRHRRRGASRPPT
jgi:hypothetical protein